MTKLYTRETFRSRSLRRKPTPAEACLWLLLRDRKLAGFKFRRQHPVGCYFADFFCVAARLAIEADGEPHVGRPLRDVRRDNYFRRLGITVLRFPNHMILEQPAFVLDSIRCALHQPAPPLPHGP